MIKKFRSLEISSLILLFSGLKTARESRWLPPGCGPAPREWYFPDRHVDWNSLRTSWKVRLGSWEKPHIDQGSFQALGAGSKQSKGSLERSVWRLEDLKVTIQRNCRSQTNQGTNRENKDHSEGKIKRDRVFVEAVSVVVVLRSKYLAIFQGQLSPAVDFDVPPVSFRKHAFWNKENYI